MFRKGKDVIEYPKCGKAIRISELKLVFKQEYLNPDGSLELSRREILGCGWLKKVPNGIACPKCGEIIGEPE